MRLNYTEARVLIPAMVSLIEKRTSCLAEISKITEQNLQFHIPKSRNILLKRTSIEEYRTNFQYNMTECQLIGPLYLLSSNKKGTVMRLRFIVLSESPRYKSGKL